MIGKLEHFEFSEKEMAAEEWTLDIPWRTKKLDAGTFWKDDFNSIHRQCNSTRFVVCRRLRINSPVHWFGSIVTWI